MNRVPPFVKITLITLCGVIASQYFTLPLWIGITIVIVCSIIFVLQQRYNNIVASLAAVVALLSFGFILTPIHKTEELHFDNYRLSKPTYKAIVKSSMKNKTKRRSCDIEIIKVYNDSVEIVTTGNVIAYMPLEMEKMDIGDTIRFRSTPKITRDYYVCDGFNYKKYLENMYIYHTVFINDFVEIRKSDGLSIRGLLERAKLWTASTLDIDDQYLTEFQISKALLIGDKENMSPELKADYSRLGIAHILTVSGLHVGIIFLIFSTALSFLNYNRQSRIIKAGLILIVIWFYAGLAEFAAPVQRSALMFSILTLGNISSSRYSSLNALFFSCFISVVINPLVINTIGFQMSYIAVLSIIVIGNYIQNRIIFSNRAVKYVFGMAVITVSAQVAILPISAYYFHQVSFVFLLTNIVVVPLFTFVIIPLLIIGISLAWVPILSDTAILTCYKILKAINKLAVQLSTSQYTAIENVYISLTEVIVIYIVIILTTTLVYKSLQTQRYN